MSIGQTKECPFCAETIKAAARLCRFCGRDLPRPDPGVVHAPVLAPTPAAATSGPTAGLRRSELFDLLTALVEKSLVLYDENEQGCGRYRLLETVRQYGSDRLIDAGDGELTRDEHLRFYVDLAERAERQIRIAEQVQWLDMLETEHDNFRAALAWSVQRDPQAGLRLAGVLWWFWFYRNHWREGRLQLAAVLGQPETRTHRGDRARALVGAGWLAYQCGDMAEMHTLTQECLALAREAGDAWLTSFSLAFAAVAAMSQAEPERAAVLSAESLGLAREAGDPWLHSVALMVRGAEHLIRREYDTAENLMRQSVTLAEQSGERFMRVATSVNLAAVLLVSGNHAPIRALVRRSLELVQELGQKMWIAPCLEILAGVEATASNGERAARLLGAAEALREAIGYPLETTDSVFYDQAVSTTRDQLSSERFAAAWAEGRALPLEEAIDYALDADEDRS